MRRGDYQKYEFSTACAAYGAKGKKLGNIDTQLLSEVGGDKGRSDEACYEANASFVICSISTGDLEPSLTISGKICWRK